MAKYRVQDSGYGEDFEAADEDAAFAYAKEWLRSGDWYRSHTIWLDATVFAYDGDTEERLGSVTVSLPPDEPTCVDEEHVWCSPYELLGGVKENPGVWGSGGGVRIKEVCKHCGAYKLVDTWATNPTDGTQGHRSVEYLPPDSESLEWVRQLQTEEVSDG